MTSDPFRFSAKEKMKRPREDVQSRLIKFQLRPMTPAKSQEIFLITQEFIKTLYGEDTIEQSKVTTPGEFTKED